MENFLRKYGWTLRLAGIAAVCLLVAMAINGALASMLAPYTVPSTPNLFEQAKGTDKSKNGANSKSSATQNWSRTLAERCFFGCVEKVDEVPTCPEEGCPEGEQCVSGQCVSALPLNAVVGDGTLPVPSDLNLKLMGVMVSSKAEWSTALLEDQGTKQTYIVRTEEDVVPQATLKEVRRDRIIIERNGRLEYIRLVDTITGNPQAALGARSGAPPSTAKPINTPANLVKPAQASKDAGKTVQRTDNNAYAVDRKSMNAQLENRAALAKGATIVPNYKNGKKSGLKLVNVASDSVYQQLGMKSGDVLQSVNGEKIRSQAHAMEMMDRFRKADSVTIEVERGGKKEKIKYDIK